MHIYAGDNAFVMAKFLLKDVMLRTYRRARVLAVQGVVDQRSGSSAGPDVRPALFYSATCLSDFPLDGDGCGARILGREDRPAHHDVISAARKSLRWRRHALLIA